MSTGACTVLMKCPKWAQFPIRSYGRLFCFKQTLLLLSSSRKIGRYISSVTSFFCHSNHGDCISFTFEGEKDIQSSWTEIELRRKRHKEALYVRVFLWSKEIFWASLYRHVAGLLKESLKDLVAINNSVSQWWQLHKWYQGNTAINFSPPTISYPPLWGDYIIQGETVSLQVKIQERLLEFHKEEGPFRLTENKEGVFLHLLFTSLLQLQYFPFQIDLFFLSWQLSI